MAESLLNGVDVEIRAQVALATNSIFALRELRVERDGEVLIISGRVASFYYKQLAQEVVRAVARGVTVENSIDVD